MCVSMEFLLAWIQKHFYHWVITISFYWWLINSTETLPSDVESPVEIQATQQERHRLPTDTDSNMDETSSTMVMIAQSKALFDRLETEAKVCRYVWMNCSGGVAIPLVASGYTGLSSGRLCGLWLNARWSCSFIWSLSLLDYGSEFFDSPQALRPPWTIGWLWGFFMFRALQKQ